MSDINAAPSSTEPSNEAAKTDMQEAGVPAVGEPAGSGSASSAPLSTSDASETLSTSASTSLPAVSDASTSATTSTGDSSSSASTLANSADAGNAAASPAAGQSASDTASSAQGASQGVDIAVGAWPGNAVFVTHEEVLAANDELQSLYRDARARIAELEQAFAIATPALEQQVTDEQERVIKWQSMYNAACAVKPHAQSLLQKLEAGEAIVLGDLQAKLRAFVEAL